MTSNEELKQELQLEEPMTYIERNGVYYQVPEFVKKDLEDFKWLKSKLNLTFLNTLSDPEDKERVLEIMGIRIDY